MSDRNVIDGLNGFLADATVFYQKLRHYHWNVAGPEFFDLHAKFEEVYTAWAVSIDEVAERVLMVGGVPLHTLASMLKTATLQEDESVPGGRDMVDAVLADLNALRARAGTVIEAAEAASDRGTVNLLDGLCDVIEKEAWMFSAWKAEAAQTWR
jgi:starvation-inducible DNA-binding protein